VNDFVARVKRFVNKGLANQNIVLVISTVTKTTYLVIKTITADAAKKARNGNHNDFDLLRIY